MKALRQIILSCLVVLSFSTTVYSLAPMANTAGFGGKIGLNIVDNEGAAFGWGAHFLYGFDLRGAGTLAIYPNVEFWVHRNDYFDRSYDPDRLYHVTLFQTNINFDARYYFPIKGNIPVNPFVGFGFGPDITSWNPESPYYFDQYNYYRDTDVSVLFSFFGGIDIPISSNIRPFFEMRIKPVGYYTVFKMTAGLTFLL